MKVIEYSISKKKKLTKKLSIELSNLFAPHKPKNRWDYKREDEWLYRPITYLFDDGKNYIWTNTPKLHLGQRLIGLFYYKNKIVKF